MKKSQNGSISIFVMFTMLFFLFTIAGLYSISSRNFQAQTSALNEIKSEYYSQNIVDTYNSMENQLDFIPIYTKEQLLSIGTENEFFIDGKIYDFSNMDYSKYELMNNIVIDLKENYENLRKYALNTNSIYITAIKNNGNKIIFYYENNYYLPVKYHDKYNEYSFENDSANLVILLDSNEIKTSLDETEITENYFSFKKIEY